MTQLSQPRDDNPREEFDERTKRIRMICTDCVPEVAVIDRDVAYWDEMPSEMVSKDAQLRACDDFVAWLEHMRDVHGISPNFTGTIVLPQV